jgi:hypothetical protein
MKLGKETQNELQAVMDTLLWETLLHFLQTPLSDQGRSEEGNTLNVVWS